MQLLEVVSIDSHIPVLKLGLHINRIPVFSVLCFYIKVEEQNKTKTKQNQAGLVVEAVVTNLSLSYKYT